MVSYQPYTPGQDLLLPPTLTEWLPEGHLALLHQRYGGCAGPGRVPCTSFNQYADEIFSLGAELTEQLEVAATWKLLAERSDTNVRLLRVYADIPVWCRAAPRFWLHEALGKRKEPAFSDLIKSQKRIEEVCLKQIRVSSSWRHRR